MPASTIRPFVKTIGRPGRGPDQPLARSRSASRAACRAIFNELYKKKTGGDDLDDVSARGLQGFLVLADAINRAGSTEPAKIQAALKATDLQGRPDGRRATTA